MKTILTGIDGVNELTDAAVIAWYARREGSRTEVIGVKDEYERRVAAAAGYKALDANVGLHYIERMTTDRAGAYAVAVKINGIA